MSKLNNLLKTVSSLEELAVTNLKTLGEVYTIFDERTHSLYSSVSEATFYSSKVYCVYLLQKHSESVKGLTDVCKIISCKFCINDGDGVAGKYIADRQDYFCRYAVKNQKIYVLYDKQSREYIAAFPLYQMCAKAKADLIAEDMNKGCMLSKDTIDDYLQTADLLNIRYEIQPYTFSVLPDSTL